MKEIEIVIKKSKKRKRTIQSLFNKESRVLTINAPYFINDLDLNNFIEKCLEKIKISENSKEHEAYLEERAKKLVKRYYFSLKIPNFKISYSDSYLKVWGKCYYHKKEIKINRELKKYPNWVEDSVILHEIAHLLENNHGKKFHKICNLYPKSERAIGFLSAIAYN